MTTKMARYKPRCFCSCYRGWYIHEWCHYPCKEVILIQQDIYEFIFILSQLILVNEFCVYLWYKNIETKFVEPGVVIRWGVSKMVKSSVYSDFVFIYPTKCSSPTQVTYQPCQQTPILTSISFHSLFLPSFY
jgi:hypothetical protein